MKCKKSRRHFYLRLLGYLLSPFLIILYLTLFLPLAIVLKVLDRLMLLLLRRPTKKIKPVRVIKQPPMTERIPEDELNELNDLFDPESDVLETLLKDELIRDSIITHLETCYDYRIKKINDTF